MEPEAREREWRTAAAFFKERETMPQWAGNSAQLAEGVEGAFAAREPWQEREREARFSIKLSCSPL